MRSETNNINDTYHIYKDIGCLNKKINFVFIDRKYSNSSFRYRMTQLNRWDKVIFQMSHELIWYNIFMFCHIYYLNWETYRIYWNISFWVIEPLYIWILIIKENIIEMEYMTGNKYHIKLTQRKWENDRLSVRHSKPYAKKASFYRYAKIAEPFCIEAHGSFYIIGSTCQ